MFRRLLAVLTAVLGIIASRMSFAQGVETTIRPCTPCVPDGGCRAVDCRRPMAAQVVRTSSRVRADLDGRVVRYEVTETYTNRGRMVGEADYLLPLPKGAAFEELALSINGEMVTGETMNSERARRYTRKSCASCVIRRSSNGWATDCCARASSRSSRARRSASSSASARVAEREGDALRLDWLGDRRAGDTGDNSSFTLGYPDDGALGDAYSPTHSLHVTHERNRRVARIDDARGPVTMLVPVRSRTSAAVSLLANAPTGEDGFALITLSPPAQSVRATPRATSCW